MYRILLVEDDSMVQQVLKEMLRPEGHEVLASSTGGQGLVQAVKEKPDLIILDINLPDLNGVDVCRKLKADPRTRHIPVLMLSGEAREVAQKVSGLESGAEDYLFKPINVKVLVARVSALLKLSTRPT